MVELLAGNVLLKPCQKRRVLSHLRRCDRLSDRMGDSKMAVSLRRSGRYYEARATCRNRRGSVECHAKNANWESAVALMVRSLHDKVHAQRLMANS